jgi:hypothetical protein
MPSGPLPDDVIRGLRVSAERIEQVRRIVAASEVLPPDIHFAAERIGDIARALRSRDVDVVLCDSLEQIAGEIGDAAVGQRAVAVGLSSAAVLIDDLARDMAALIARADELVSAAGAVSDQAVAAACSSSLNEVPHETAEEEALLSQDERSGSLPDDAVPSAAPLPQPLPEIKALVSKAENADDERARPTLPLPSPLAHDEKNNVKANAPRPLTNSDTINAEQPSLQDLLSDLRALSDDELIALFG